MTRIIYCQRMRLPSQTAHAIHTALTASAFAEAGASASMLLAAPPPGALQSAKDFFLCLGLDALPAGLSLNVAPLRHKGLYGMLFRAWLWLRLRQPQSLCWASSVKEAALALSLRPKGQGRPPVLFEVHHLISILKTGAEARRLAALEKKVFEQADMVVFNCEALQRAANKRLPRPKLSLVSPIGYNERVISPARQPDMPEPSEQTGSVRLVYAGSLQEGKGVGNLVRALGLLPESYLLTVIGGGDESWRIALARMVEEEGLEGRVTFTGRVKQRDMPSLLSGCDIFVIPINTENDFFAPIKMYEALGYAMPIVATPTASLKDGLLERENALFASDFGPQALAVAIETLGENPDLRQAMRQANRERATGLTIARRARNLLEVFEREFAKR